MCVSSLLIFSYHSHSQLNFPSPAVQQKVSEENGARMRAESRVVEVEKQCSMLEFDLKQSVQKMEQLMKQKERLEDEVSNPSHPAVP